MAEQNENEKKQGAPTPGSGGTGGRSTPASSTPPSLRDSKKLNFRMGPLAGRTTIMERLRQFKKKDLIFIVAGLSVLLLAPILQHFALGPAAENGGAFQPGWNMRDAVGGGSGGPGSGPADMGYGGMAPGGLAGVGSDIITPLNVRDPSSLIMGPESEVQPPAGAGTGAAKPENASSWKDALANAAARGADAGISKGGLPSAPPQLSTTMHGLAALGEGGGGGGGGGLPPISASDVPNKPAANNSLSNVQGSGVVGSAGPTRGATSGGMDGLKAAAYQQGAAFNGDGSAGGALTNAASQAIPTGSAGSGEGGGGAGGNASDKSTDENIPKDQKSMGESLAALAAKENLEKSIDLKWQKETEKEMRWPKIQTATLTTLVGDVTKTVSGTFNTLLGGLFAAATGTAATYTCGSYGPKVPDCSAGGNGSCSTKRNGIQVYCATYTPPQGGGSPQCIDPAGGVVQCTANSSDGSSTPQSSTPGAGGNQTFSLATNASPAGAPGAPGSGLASMLKPKDAQQLAAMGSMCTQLESVLNPTTNVQGAAAVQAPDPQVVAAATDAELVLGKLESIHNGLNGATNSDVCAQKVQQKGFLPNWFARSPVPVMDILQGDQQKLSDAGTQLTTAIGSIGSVTNSALGQNYSPDLRTIVGQSGQITGDQFKTGAPQTKISGQLAPILTDALGHIQTVQKNIEGTYLPQARADLKAVEKDLKTIGSSVPDARSAYDRDIKGKALTIPNGNAPLKQLKSDIESYKRSVDKEIAAAENASIQVSAQNSLLGKIRDSENEMWKTAQDSVRSADDVSSTLHLYTLVQTNDWLQPYQLDAAAEQASGISLQRLSNNLKAYSKTDGSSKDRNGFSADLTNALKLQTELQKVEKATGTTLQTLGPSRVSQ